MNFPLKIALRYLFSHKQHHAVNIISLISVSGVAVATMAMVVVLSIFNGFSKLSEDRLSLLAPPLQITSADSNVISSVDSLNDVLSSINEITRIEPIITHQALAAVQDAQTPVNILGVSDTFSESSCLKSVIIDGDDNVGCDSVYNYAVLSVGVAIDLNIRPGSFKYIDIYVPRREGNIHVSNPSSSFRSESFIASGVYQLQQDTYDMDIIILPISSARNLLDYDENTASALNIYTSDVSSVKSKLNSVLPDYNIKSRIEQEENSFKMISIEKWVTFLMLAFILIIASFNIISTISILIIDKRPNMDILRAMGATDGMIRKIFVFQGWLICLAGGLIGIIAGVVLSLAQQFFGIIKITAASNANLATDVYPVVVNATDVLIVTAVIIGTGLITGIIAAGKKVC